MPSSGSSTRTGVRVRRRRLGCVWSCGSTSTSYTRPTGSRGRTRLITITSPSWLSNGEQSAGYRTIGDVIDSDGKSAGVNFLERSEVILRPIHVGTRRGPRAALLSAAGLTVGVALSVGGCSGGRPRAGSPVSSPSFSTTSTSAGKSGGTTTTADSNSAVSSCSSSELQFSAEPGQGATGNWAFPIIFRNISSKVCSLYGYPGVSWVTASGTSIGVPARQVHDPASPASTVNLRPGQSAYSEVEVPTAANQQLVGCLSVPAAGIRVYAPGSTTAVLLSPSSNGPDHNSLLYCNIAAASGGISPVTAS